MRTGGCFPRVTGRRPRIRRLLPAAVQSIARGGGAGARDVGQLSDRELRVELAVSSAWVSYLRIMNDPESRRERQLQRAEVLGYLTYREHFRWWSEDLREQFPRTLEACGPAAVLLG